MLSRGGVAPLPPSFHKLLSVTVTPFAVFPSWMYLLGGDDNYMLTVPSSTCHPRNCCWQRGDICQAIADAAFTLVSSALWTSPIEDDLLFALVCYLPTFHLFCDSRLLGLTLRHYAPVFRCHRVSWTRGRLALAQEAVRVSLFFIFSNFLFLLIFARSFRQPSSNFSSRDIEM